MIKQLLCQNILSWLDFYAFFTQNKIKAQFKNIFS